MQTERVVWQQQREVFEEALRQLRSDKEACEAEVEAEMQRRQRQIAALEGQVQELQVQLQLQQEKLQQQVQLQASLPRATSSSRPQSKGVREGVSGDGGDEVEFEAVESEGESEEAPSRPTSAAATLPPAISLPPVSLPPVSALEDDSGGRSPRVDDLHEVSAVQNSGFVLVNEVSSCSAFACCVRDVFV